MAEELFNVGGQANEVRVTYERAMLMRAVPYFAHAVPAWFKEGPIPARGGITVNFRRLELVASATTALTEGTPPSDTQITISAVNATVSQYGQVTRFSDVLETQAIDPIIAETVEMYGESLGNTIDQVARNVMAAGTTVQYASTAGSRAQVGSGMNLNYAELRKMIAVLETNNAKRFPDGAYKAIIHPNTKRDLFNDTQLLNTFQYAGPRDNSNQLIQGQIGRFYGIDFLETSNATVYSSAGLSGADIYGTIIFGREAFGKSEFQAHQDMRVIIKPRGSAGTADPLDQVSTVGWKASFVAVILNQAFVGRIEHDTSNKP